MTTLHHVQNGLIEVDGEFKETDLKAGWYFESDGLPIAGPYETAKDAAAAAEEAENF